MKRRNLILICILSLILQWTGLNALAVNTQKYELTIYAMNGWKCVNIWGTNQNGEIVFDDGTQVPFIDAEQCYRILIPDNLCNLTLSNEDGEETDLISVTSGCHLCIIIHEDGSIDIETMDSSGTTGATEIAKHTLRVSCDFNANALSVFTEESSYQGYFAAAPGTPMSKHGNQFQVKIPDGLTSLTITHPDSGWYCTVSFKSGRNVDIHILNNSEVRITYPSSEITPGETKPTASNPAVTTPTAKPPSQNQGHQATLPTAPPRPSVTTPTEDNNQSGGNSSNNSSNAGTVLPPDNSGTSQNGTAKPQPDDTAIVPTVKVPVQSIQWESTMGNHSNNSVSGESNVNTISRPAVPTPVVTEPAVTTPNEFIDEPEVTAPQETQPQVTEPVITEPVITEPDIPAQSEPLPTDPIVEQTEPVTEDPSATVPNDQPSDDPPADTDSSAGSNEPIDQNEAQSGSQNEGNILRINALVNQPIQSVEMFFFVSLSAGLYFVFVLLNRRRQAVAITTDGVQVPARPALTKKATEQLVRDSAPQPSPGMDDAIFKAIANLPKKNNT